MLRLAALLALVIGLGGFGGYLVLIGKSPFASREARHLREMKDRVEAPGNWTRLTEREFAALPTGNAVAEHLVLERQGAIFEGYVQNLLRAADGDFHLELVDTIPRAGREPYVTAEIAPQTRGKSNAWTFENLAWDFRPSIVNGMKPWHTPPQRVRISGWLLDDFPHRSDAGEPRASGWEIHPVTAIEIWNQPAGAWEPLAR